MATVLVATASVEAVLVAAVLVAMVLVAAVLVEMSKKWVNVRIAGGCLEYVFFALFAKSMFDSAGGEREK